VESDVDFIVVLPFNYTDNNGKFVTKIMLDDEFMGSKSECNFDKREECSEKGSLYCVLCENKATSWLRKITTGVSEINAKIHDYSFDLAFVAYPWERNSEQVLNFIKSEESLKNLNEIDNFILNFTKQFGTNLQYDRFGMINSLSGYRANIRINEITAKNKTKFRLLLLSLKLWAKSHFVYDGKLGFFSGTSLAILVTKILVDFNSSKMTIYQLLAKVEDSNNTLVNKQKIDEHLETELEPIFIVEETNGNIEKLREAIDWNETKERESRNNLYINNSENVLRDQIIEKQQFLEEAPPYQKQILETEIKEKQSLLIKVMLNRKSILEKNAKMEKHTKLAKSKISKKLDGNHEDLRNQWEGLISGGGEFKNKYDQFLAIVCTYNPTNEYGDEFCDFSTTRIRLQLLFSIETEIDAICHANLQKPIRDKKQCPKEFRKKGWVCIIWLVGIDFGINGKDKNISSQNLVLEDKENIFRDAKGKQILEEFKEKIISSYLPRKKGVYSYLSKMSEEERDVIMSQLGIETLQNN
uniref:Polynucleotide adenylyltransferase n=1 Tax=Meloidogyne floridensis TaxID=298350 RepID=A0A915NKH6_9BILA